MSDTKTIPEHIDDVQGSQNESLAEGTEPVEENIEKGYWKSPRFIGSCIAIILLANNLFIGYAMPANILSIINADIGPSPNIYLVTLVNTLIKGTCLLLIGSVSDAVGRRYFIIGGQTCGLIGAVICATSKNINTLIGASALTGIAGSAQILYPLLSQELVPNKYRGWSQGVITLFILPTIGFGPIIARTMAANLPGSWRWCYWLNTIVITISLVLFIFCYFPPVSPKFQSRKSRLDQLRQIDYIGFIVYAAGLVCLLLGLTWGGRQYPWSSARVIALLCVGIVLLVAFVLYEIYAPLEQPLLPMSLFKIRNFSIAVVVGSIGQMSFYAMNVLWPTHVSNLYTSDPHLIGWMTCTTGLALTIGEIIAGPLFRGLGNVKWQMVTASAGLTIFGGILATCNEFRQSLAIAMTVLNGMFIGWIELATLVVAGLVIPPERIGTGQAFFASTRAVAGTLATSVYLAIYNSKLSTNMPAAVEDYALRAGLPQSSVPQLLIQISNGTAAAFAQVPGVNTTILTAIVAGQKHAWSSSLSTVYLSSLAYGGTALILSFLASNVDKYLTNYVNKTVTSSAAPRNQEAELEK